MRKKTPAGPCRTLSAEQRAEVEKQMRDAGRPTSLPAWTNLRSFADAGR